MRRPLGRFESAEAWTGEAFPYNAVVVLRLAAGPAPGRLEAALAAVRARHPLLGARLELRGSRWWFVTDDEPRPVPLRRLPRRGEDDWRPVAEEELNSAMATGVAPLVRCALLAPAAGGGACEIVLAFHHALVDAAAVLTVCGELLESCAGRGEPARPAEALPPRPDDLFPARFRGPAAWPRLAAFLARQLAGEVSYLVRSRGSRSAVPPQPVRCRILPAALAEAATTALVRRCRRERVPLNAALNAALLQALGSHLHGERVVPLRYFAFPDLRPYLEPPVPPRVVGSYLTTMRFSCTPRPGEPFWELARRIDRQLYRSFRRGEKFLFCTTSERLLRQLIRLRRLRFGNAAVSYTGPLAAPAGGEEPRLRGLHAFVSNIAIGPELSAQARLFRDRLWLDFVYLDADMQSTQAATVTGDVLQRLEAAAA